MAEVNHPIGLARQLRLVMGLRWMTFRNGLRSKTEKMNVASTILVGLLWTAMSFGVGIAVCFGAYQIALSKEWIWLAAIFWGVFMFWQFFPLLASQANIGLDDRNLLRFPLSFSAFFLLSAASGLADPFAATGIFWQVAAGAGVSIARPDLIPWAILAISASVLMNLLFNRMLFSWLARILATRRMREIAGALFVLIILSVQLSGMIAQRWGPQIRGFVARTQVVWQNLPPSEAAIVLQRAATGDTGAASEAAGVLLLYTVGFGAFFVMRARAQFTGEDLGESAAPSAAPRRAAASRAATGGAAGAAQISTDHASGLLSAPVAAIFIKELRYLYRNTMVLMNLFLPFIFIVPFAFNWSHPRHGGGSPFGSHFSADFIYPAAVAYVCLLIIQFAPNCLAYEGRGVERLFLAPVKFRDVMAGKNLFLGMLLALEALFVLCLVTALGYAPRLPIFLATWAALPFFAFIQFSMGNWLSLQFPRRVEFGVRRSRPSGITTLVTFSTFFVTNAILGLIAALCFWLAGVWTLVIVYLSLSAGAFAVYRVMLDGVSQRAIVQRETLIDQLAK